MEPGKETSAKKLTKYGPGFRYNLFWSPDNKKLAFIDKAMKIMVYDFNTNKTIQVDKGLRMSHGNLESFTCSWSSDSRWLSFSCDLENYHNSIRVYDYTNNKLHQLTSGFYSCANPVFDPDGKYLYVFTDQSYQPNYSNIDNTFIYANSAQVAAIALSKTTPSLLYAKNDEVGIKKDDEKQKADSLKKVLKDAGIIDTKKKSGAVDIDMDDIERRLVILSMKAGNYSNLSAIKDKIIFQPNPYTGTTDGKPSLHYFDTEKREEKTILDDVSDYVLSADGKKYF